MFLKLWKKIQKFIFFFERLLGFVPAKMICKELNTVLNSLFAQRCLKSFCADVLRSFKMFKWPNKKAFENISFYWPNPSFSCGQEAKTHTQKKFSQQYLCGQGLGVIPGDPMASDSITWGAKIQLKLRQWDTSLSKPLVLQSPLKVLERRGQFFCFCCILKKFEIKRWICN